MSSISSFESSSKSSSKSPPKPPSDPSPFKHLHDSPGQEGLPRPGCGNTIVSSNSSEGNSSSSEGSSTQSDSKTQEIGSHPNSEDTGAFEQPKDTTMKLDSHPNLEKPEAPKGSPSSEQNNSGPRSPPRRKVRRGPRSVPLRPGAMTTSGFSPAPSGSSQDDTQKPTRLSPGVKDLASRIFVPLPYDAKLSLLSPESSEQGAACIPDMHFRFGLTFPFPELFSKLLKLHKLSPAQLHPNAVVVIMAFLVNCKRCNVDATLLLFQSFYYLHASNVKTSPGVYTFSPRTGVKDFLVGKQQSVKGWMTRGYYSFDTAVYPYPPWNHEVESEAKAPFLPKAVVEKHQLLSSHSVDIRQYYHSFNTSYWWPKEIYTPVTFTQPRFYVPWPAEGRYFISTCV
jgi:putative gypsy type transposon